MSFESFDFLLNTKYCEMNESMCELSLGNHSWWGHLSFSWLVEIYFEIFAADIRIPLVHFLLNWVEMNEEIIFIKF